MRLDLDKALGNEKATIEKGRNAFKAASSSSPLPPAPPPPSKPVSPLPPPSATPSPVPSSEPDDEVDDSGIPSALSEAQKDLADGVGVFAAGTDTIIAALFLVLGKFERVFKLMLLGTGLAALILVSCIIAIIRVEGLISGLAADRQELRSMKNDLQASRSENQQTQQDVAAVKKAAEEVSNKQPDISIVADKRTGQAKVVIQPKPRLAGAKPLSTAAKKAKAEAPAAAIELPIALPKGSRVVGASPDVEPSADSAD